MVLGVTFGFPGLKFLIARGGKLEAGLIDERARPRKVGSGEG